MVAHHHAAVCKRMTWLLWVTLCVGADRGSAIAQPPVGSSPQPSASLQAQVPQPYSGSISGMSGAVSSDPSSYNLLHVNPTTGQDASGTGTSAAPFKTLAHALEVAQPNTVIVLAPGTYSEASGETFPLRLKPGVTVQGDPNSGGRNTVIQGGGFFVSSAFGRQNVAILGADQAGLNGVTVTNTNPRGYGLWLESTSPVVVDNTFRGSTHDGVSVVGRGTPIIRGNYFTQNGTSGISLFGTSQAQVQNNVFENTGFGILIAQDAAPFIAGNRILQNRNGVVVQANARPVLRNNVIEGNAGDGLVAIANARPDLGSATHPGGNLFRNNKHRDIRGEVANQATLAYGNQLSSSSPPMRTERPTVAPPPPPMAPAPTPLTAASTATPNAVPAAGQGAVSRTMAPPPRPSITAVRAQVITPTAQPRTLTAEAFPVPSSLRNSSASQQAEVNDREVELAIAPSPEDSPPVAAAPPTPVPEDTVAIPAVAEADPEAVMNSEASPVESPIEPIETATDAASTADGIPPASQPSAAQAIAPLPEDPLVERPVSEAAPVDPVSELEAPEGNQASTEAATTAAVAPPEGPAERSEPESSESELALATGLPSTRLLLHSTASAAETPTPDTAEPREVLTRQRAVNPRVSRLLARLRARTAAAANVDAPSQQQHTSNPSPTAETPIPIPVIPPPGVAAPTAEPEAADNTEAERRDRQPPVGAAQPPFPIPAADNPISIPILPPETGSAPPSASATPPPEFDTSQTALRSPLPGGVLPVPSAPIPVGSGGSSLPTVSVPANAVSLSSNGPPPPPSRAGILGLRYRVIVEATDSSAQTRVRSLVPDAFRTQYNGQVMMQAGAYRDRVEADQMMLYLENNGFRVFLAQTE